MFTGRLLAIAISPVAAGPMQVLETAEVVAERGIVGDRYAGGIGTFQQGKYRPKPKQAITLIEQESLDAALRDYELQITHADSRRNLLTLGVPLNHLVGVKFQVGEVVLEGVELCEPCGHLEKLTFAGLKKALLHRGGLRASVVRGGTIRPGDKVTLFE